MQERRRGARKGRAAFGAAAPYSEGVEAEHEEAALGSEDAAPSSEVDASEVKLEVGGGERSLLGALLAAAAASGQASTGARLPPWRVEDVWDSATLTAPPLTEPCLASWTRVELERGLALYQAAIQGSLLTAVRPCTPPPLT